MPELYPEHDYMDTPDRDDLFEDYGYCRECGAPLVSLGAMSDRGNRHDEVVCPNCEMLPEEEIIWDRLTDIDNSEAQSDNP